MSLVFPRPPERGPSTYPDVLHSESVACACGNSIVVGSLQPSTSTGTESVSVRHLQTGLRSSSITCLAFGGTMLAACTDDKHLRVWSAASWELLGERTVPKRATALEFTGDDRFLLVADKSGEVTSYDVSRINTDNGRHVLGHFSMILDMVLPPDGSHVITCDRDEKIRVSQYPNSYNIETFCLGHTEFVSVLSRSAKWPSILLSGGGDGTVRTWNWLTGQLLYTEEIGSHPQHQDPAVVTHIVCSHSTEDTVVMVATDSSAELLSFLLSADGTLVPNPDGAISLAARLWSIAFDWLDRLWVCLAQEEEPLQCYRLEQNKFMQVPCDDSPLLKGLCNWEYFKGCETSVKDWSQLRKHTFDNMSAYLARKEERIRSKKEGKLTADVEGQPHPPKVPKLDTERPADSHEKAL